MIRSMTTALVAVTFAVSAHAQDEGSNRDLLISKLSTVHLNLAPADPSKTAVTLRLADLLAERARVAAMKELEAGCTDCKAGVADRKKALSLYLEAVEKAPLSAQGKVRIQIGHLYQQTGQDGDAVKAYNAAIEKVDIPGVKAEAHLALAEMAFKKRDFAGARAHYQEVLKVPTAASRGLAAYRSSWCSLNLGDLEGAIAQIETILKTPALLNRSGNADSQIDVSFQSEVSLDYATFLSRRTTTVADAQKVFDLSPEVSRLGNVTHLARENERLGKKPEALAIWNFVYEKQSEPAARQEALIHRADLNLNTGRKDEAVKAFELALAMPSCNGSLCEDNAKGLRRFVVSWNQMEKKNPTAELVQAYGHYLEKFPQDSEVTLWAAQAARDSKDLKGAYAFYGKAAALFAVPATDAKVVAENKKALENALLSSIEVAEEMKDDAQMDQAYDAYLAQSPTQAKAFDVRYQKAHKLYEKADYAKATDVLRTMALDPKGEMKLRQQSADLALDALVILKDTPRLEAWAGDFAKAFPERAKDFTQIQQKAVLTQSAELAAKSPDEALIALGRFQASKAAPEDRITYLKNKILLAEKTGHYPEARAGVDDLLLAPGLTEKDREFALGRKIYFAELALDFKTAFEATEKMPFAAAQSDQKFLKLALYSDLAGLKSQDYYQQYLQRSKDEDAKKLIAAELVRKSANPLQTMTQQKAVIDPAPALKARLYTEAYAKTGSEEILKKALADEKIKSEGSRKILERVAYLKEFAPLRDQLRSHKIDSSNQKKLAAGIKARVALLEKAEKTAQKAIQSADWTAQLVALDLVAKESDRFYQELMSLPVPAGLTGEDEQQYLSLLSQQAAPYQAKAQQAQVKVQEFWKDSGWKKSLEDSVQGDARLKGLVAVELGALKDVAPEEHKAFLSDLVAATQAPAKVVPLAEVEAARQDLRAKPFDKGGVEKLLGLEKQNQNFAMVQYLEGRLKTLEDGKVSTP